MAAYAIYVFCRQADEIADCPEAKDDSARAFRRLSSLREQLRKIYSGVETRDPKLRALQATILKYGIPAAYFADLIRGVTMDLTKKSYESFAELEDYCHSVASSVGLMMTKVFGALEEGKALQYSKDMGTAMQLTNILRDVGEDYHRGRMYLPADEMRRFGVREEHVMRGVVTREFVNLMKFQVDRARAFYERAIPGIPMLTDDGSRFCVTLMSRTYAHILSVIEQNGYDTLSRRAYVPFMRKACIALGAYVKKEEISDSSVFHRTASAIHVH